MKSFFYFLVMLVRTSYKDAIIPLASELTYRLIFALFPFIIFLMSLVGFFNIDSGAVMDLFANTFPDDMMNVISTYVQEVVDVKSSGIMSVSLVVAAFSASSGFKALIKGINRVNRQKETRKFYHVWLVRALLVVLMAFAIISSILLLVFGDAMYSWLVSQVEMSGYIDFIFGLAGNLIIMVVLLFTIIFVYKFGSCKKLTIYQVMPGSLVTLIVWVLSSKAFNLYINNFARYSRVYGSIASIFIMMLWLNLISVIILIGAEINALLDIDGEKKQTD